MSSFNRLPVLSLCLLMTSELTAVGAVTPLPGPVEQEIISAEGVRLKVKIIAVTPTTITFIRLTDGQEFTVPKDRLSAEYQGFASGLIEGAKLLKAADKDVEKHAVPPEALALTSTDELKKFMAVRTIPALGRIEGFFAFIEKNPSLNYPNSTGRFVAQGLLESETSSSRVTLTTALTSRIHQLQDSGTLPASMIELLANTEVEAVTYSGDNTAWKAALDRFAQVCPSSSALNKQYIEYSKNLRISDPEAADAYLATLLLDPHKPLVAAATKEQELWKTIGPIEKWKAPSLDGRVVDIGKMRGKVVLMFFWSQAGTCLKELPNVKQLYDKYKKEGLQVVGVPAIDAKETPESAIKNLTSFIHINKITWPQLYNDQIPRNAYTTAYGTSDLPYTLILDRDGKRIECSNLTQAEPIISDLLNKPDPLKKKSH